MIALEIACPESAGPLSPDFQLSTGVRFRKMKNRVEAHSICVCPETRKGRLRRCMSTQWHRWSRELAINPRRTEPLRESRVRDGDLSYGLSSLGYGLGVCDWLKIFTNRNSVLIDRTAFDERPFAAVQADSGIVSPISFASVRSIEYFRIPRDVLTICVGNRTYARGGITCVSNAIRAGVGEIRNTENLQHLRDGQGICQRRTVPDSIIPH